MTDAELKGLAAQALNMGKKDMRQGDFNGLLAVYYSGRLRRLTSIETLIAERLGADWQNHGKTKDVAFNTLREIVGLMRPDAMIWVAASNMFLPTAKLKAMGRETCEELAKEGHDRHHEAVKEGLFSIQDALVAVVQTSTRVCLYQQPYSRSGFMGQPQVSLFDQDHFGGRMKLYS
jgi:hypothetical protein